MCIPDHFALRARQYETFCLKARQYSTFCLKAAFLRNLAFQSSRMEKHSPKPRAAKTQPETQRLDSDFRGPLGPWPNGPWGAKGSLDKAYCPRDVPESVNNQPQAFFLQVVERECMRIGGWCVVQHTTPYQMASIVLSCQNVKKRGLKRACGPMGQARACYQ